MGQKPRTSTVMPAGAFKFPKNDTPKISEILPQAKILTFRCFHRFLEHPSSRPLKTLHVFDNQNHSEGVQSSQPPRLRIKPSLPITQHRIQRICQNRSEGRKHCACASNLAARGCFKALSHRACASNQASSWEFTTGSYRQRRFSRSSEPPIHTRRGPG